MNSNAALCRAPLYNEMVCRRHHKLLQGTSDKFVPLQEDTNAVCFPGEFIPGVVPGAHVAELGLVHGLQHTTYV